MKSDLQNQIEKAGCRVHFIETSDYLKDPSVINELVQPFLGEADAVWGTKCTLELKDLYLFEKLSVQSPNKKFDINIAIGTGATMANWDAPVINIDLPKNELQFRMRAGFGY